jgi:hypothetical protein
MKTSSEKSPKRSYSVSRLKQEGRAWFAAHNGVACACIAALFAMALIGLFLFVAFSDFGGSADFIYNQF